MTYAEVESFLPFPYQQKQDVFTACYFKIHTLYTIHYTVHSIHKRYTLYII